MRQEIDCMPQTHICRWAEGGTMELLYKSTRSADKTVTASYAILKGLAEDG